MAITTYKTILNIKLKFTTFLRSVGDTKCVKFQLPRYKGFKDGILRISTMITVLGSAEMSHLQNCNVKKFKEHNEPSHLDLQRLLSSL